MKKIGCLSGDDDEIVVAEGFLAKVVAACNDYFKLIEKAIYTNQGFSVPDYRRRT
jgi:hypothetical protein